MLSYHGTAFFARGFRKKSDFFREIPENLHAGQNSHRPSWNTILPDSQPLEIYQEKSLINQFVPRGCLKNSDVWKNAQKLLYVRRESAGRLSPDKDFRRHRQWFMGVLTNVRIFQTSPRNIKRKGVLPQHAAANVMIPWNNFASKKMTAVSG